MPSRRETKNKRVLVRLNFEECKIRGLWFTNRERRIAFTLEAALDSETRWLNEAALEKIEPTKFVFYYAPNTIPNEDNCMAVLESFRLSDCTRAIRWIKPAR
jgi:hypothetical protein